MIIGIDISRANHTQKTGVEWYAYFLVEELKKLSLPQNVRFRLYTDTPLLGELAKLPEHWEVKVLRWPPKRFWTQIRMSIEMLLHPPDVLFIPAHVFPLIHPKKTVMTIHDIAAIRYPESYNKFERWYSVWSAKRAMKSLWKMITPSQFTKQELQQAFGTDRDADIAVIPHGYDTTFRVLSEEEKKSTMQNVLQQYGISQPFFMSIGRLEAKKNTVRIIDAFNILKKVDEASLKNAQLVLIGKPGYGYEHVQAAIEQSPFREDIILPGWVEQEHISYLINAASVFVFPSLYEGFGLPVLEAMACGTPVVASHGNSLQEVGGRSGVYVHPENSADIANAVRKMVLDEAFRHEHIADGVEQVQKFSWDNCAKNTLDILLSK
jgi:glycosyltransferase involved in cell wall biosynthesis